MPSSFKNWTAFFILSCPPEPVLSAAEVSGHLPVCHARHRAGISIILYLSG